jgi:hypothetical protein
MGRIGDVRNPRIPLDVFEMRFPGGWVVMGIELLKSVIKNISVSRFMNPLALFPL